MEENKNIAPAQTEQKPAENRQSGNPQYEPRGSRSAERPGSRK